MLVPSELLAGQIPAPFQPFLAETAGGSGHTIHHKFVVVDFNSSDPVVFAGSSNLVASGERNNGDNLFAIRDRAVATAYAVEAVRLVDHYHFRAALKAAVRPLQLQGPSHTPRRGGGPTTTRATSSRSTGACSSAEPWVGRQGAGAGRAPDGRVGPWGNDWPDEWRWSSAVGRRRARRSATAAPRPSSSPAKAPGWSSSTATCESANDDGGDDPRRGRRGRRARRRHHRRDVVRDDPDGRASSASAPSTSSTTTSASAPATSRRRRVDEEAWQRIFDVNLTGMWRTCKAVIPVMRERGRRVDREHLVDRLDLLDGDGGVPDLQGGRELADRSTSRWATPATASASTPSCPAS